MSKEIQDILRTMHDILINRNIFYRDQARLIDISISISNITASQEIFSSCHGLLAGLWAWSTTARLAAGIISLISMKALHNLRLMILLSMES